MTFLFSFSVLSLSYLEIHQCHGQKYQQRNGISHGKQDSLIIVEKWQTLSRNHHFFRTQFVTPMNDANAPPKAIIIVVVIVVIPKQVDGRRSTPHPMAQKGVDDLGRVDNRTNVETGDAAKE
jgi:hypothetical protein